MEPFDKSKLIDGIIKFFTTSKNTQITEKTDLDTDEDLKQDAEEVEEVEEVEEDIEVKEVEEVEEVKVKKTTPWFQRLYNELQDEIKLVGTTSILDLKLQQRKRPVHSKFKNLYDRHRR